MSIFKQLTDYLVFLAYQVPLSIFVFFGAMIEEIIAPIPSPMVMTIAGTIALAQERTWLFLFYLAVVGAVGKTIGCYVLYLVSDKLEDIVVGKFGRFFGLSHKEIEKLGKHFNGGLRDDIIIFLARAIPIIPTAPVSIVCGVIKVKLRTYLVSTFLGTIPRDLFYLYLGYAGLATYESVVGQFESVEKIATATLLFVVVGAFALVWYAKNKDVLVEKLEGLLDRKNKK